MFRLYTSKAYGDALIRATMKAAAKSRNLNNNDNKLISYIADNYHKKTMKYLVSSAFIPFINLHGLTNLNLHIL